MTGPGPPVIFIHGALADHTAAAGQLEAFSELFTAIAYDLRGHGQTANPGQKPYSIDDLAEDLHAFITELDLDRPVLCRVSMGGMIAQAYAARHPESLGGLVLADTFSPQRLGWRDPLERSTVVRGMAGLIRLVGYTRAKGLMLWFGRKLERDQTTSLRPDAFPDMDTADAVNALNAVAAFHRSTIEFASIAVPTLILHGEHETAIIRRHTPVLAAQIPDSSVTVVPDAGHASPWDNPSFFNETIQTFLTDETSRKPADADTAVA